MTPTNPHAAFRENLETYLTGGLAPDAAADFETHAAGCPECAAALVESRRADAALAALFQGVAPGADFEDRVIAGLRQAPSRRRVHPFVRVAAGAVAAAVVLGAVGYYGGGELDGSRPWSSPNRARASSHLREIGQAMKLVGEAPNYAFSQNQKPLASGLDRKHGGSMAGEELPPSKPAPLSWGVPSQFGMTPPSTPAINAPLAPKDTYLLPALDSRDPVKLNKQLNVAAKPGLVAGELAVPGQPPAMYYQPTAADDTKKNTSPSPEAAAAGRAYFDHLGRDEVTRSRGEPALATVDRQMTETGKPVQLAQDGAAGGKPPAAPAQPADKDATRIEQRYTGLSDPATGEQKQFPLLTADLKGEPAANSADKKVPADTHGESAKPLPETMPTTQAAAVRKIIRTGALEFEVESFDAAFTQITKIAAEESGFVASTDSQKLPNGKVQGTVTLRCAPEHLDTLVLKLRGLGDLKTQRITSQDVTKQFTDFESQLRAARAMEERLLDIIKTGKGAVKDLVEAEKQLGVYREKIETIEGELRFMGSQVALSTLQVSLTERDIRTPFAAIESEQINAGIEAEDVEKTRAEAMKLIEDAKGRVIESDLKRLDAGQLAATIVAEVSPDAAGPLGDKLKLLGRVARWDAERRQTAEGGNGSPGALQPGAKLERQATRISLSLYNLANVAPRERTTLTLVTTDVDAAYRALLATVKGDGKAPAIGRIVTSNLAIDNNGQISGLVNLEVKADQSIALDAAMRAAGSVMHLTVTENADQNGVTSVKRGYGIVIVAAANVPARETQTIAAASKDVAGTYNKLLTALHDPKLGAHVTSSQLLEQEEDNVTGNADFDIPLAARATVEAILADGKASDIVTRNVVRSSDTENTLADKLRLTVSIMGADHLPPRQSTALKLEVTDVRKMLDTAAGIGGSDAHVLERNLNQQRAGTSSATLTLDVPQSAAANTLEQLRTLGKVSDERSAENLKVASGPLSRARFEIELTNTETLVAPEEGVGFSIRAGLKKALAGLLWSVQMVVIGLVLVGPFALVAWVVWKMVRRGKAKRSI